VLSLHPLFQAFLAAKFPLLEIQVYRTKNGFFSPGRNRVPVYRTDLVGLGRGALREITSRIFRCGLRFGSGRPSVTVLLLPGGRVIIFRQVNARKFRPVMRTARLSAHQTVKKLTYRALFPALTVMTTVIGHFILFMNKGLKSLILAANFSFYTGKE